VSRRRGRLRINRKPLAPKPTLPLNKLRPLALLLPVTPLEAQSFKLQDNVLVHEPTWLAAHSIAGATRCGAKPPYSSIGSLINSGGKADSS